MYSIAQHERQQKSLNEAVDQLDTSLTNWLHSPIY